LLLGGLFGSLGDNEVGFRGKLTPKVEQAAPPVSELETLYPDSPVCRNLVRK
jgi:hypothetical protein